MNLFDGLITKGIRFLMINELRSILYVLAIIIISYQLGLALFRFLLIMGSLKIVFEWRARHHSYRCGF